MTSHSLIAQEQFHTLLVEGLSISAPANAVRHQATEIIREANTIGGNSKQNLCPFGQQVNSFAVIPVTFFHLFDFLVRPRGSRCTLVERALYSKGSYW